MDFVFFTFYNKLFFWYLIYLFLCSGFNCIYFSVVNGKHKHSIVLNSPSPFVANQRLTDSYSISFFSKRKIYIVACDSKKAKRVICVCIQYIYTHIMDRLNCFLHFQSRKLEWMEQASTKKSMVIGERYMFGLVWCWFSDLYTKQKTLNWNYIT